MSPEDQQLIERVKELDEKATKGWTYDDKIHCVVDESGAIIMDGSCLRREELDEFRGDMDFVMEARTAAPRIARLCEQQAERIAELERILVVNEKHITSLQNDGDALRDKLEAARVVLEKFLKTAQVYGLAGETNHPAVRVEVKGLTLGDFYELSKILTQLAQP